MCKRLSDLGGKRPQTARGATRYSEAATDGDTSVKEVAQAAQKQGLPDLDHARHLSAVFETVSAAIVKKAVGGRVRDLERPLF